MPDDEDVAGVVPVPSPAFFMGCDFLWVDFIEPPDMESFDMEPLFMVPSDFGELSELVIELLLELLEPALFIESLVVLVGVVDLVGVLCGAAASWAMAAPVIAIQPATIATISFVLRMTKSPEHSAP
jgi:hypothetical protein